MDYEWNNQFLGYSSDCSHENFLYRIKRKLFPDSIFVQIPLSESESESKYYLFDGLFPCDKEIYLNRLK